MKLGRWRLQRSFLFDFESVRPNVSRGGGYPYQPLFESKTSFEETIIEQEVKTGNAGLQRWRRGEGDGRGWILVRAKERRRRRDTRRRWTTITNTKRLSDDLLIYHNYRARLARFTSWPPLPYASTAPTNVLPASTHDLLVTRTSICPAAL